MPLITFTLEGAPRLECLCSARFSGTSSGSLAWRTSSWYPFVGEAENFEREVVIAPGRRTLPCWRGCAGNLSRILCSGNTGPVLRSNPFVSARDPRLSIFHLTFLSLQISSHHPELELMTLLISHDGITMILYCVCRFISFYKLIRGNYLDSSSILLNSIEYKNAVNIAFVL